MCKLAVAFNGRFWVRKLYHCTRLLLLRRNIRKRDQQRLNLCLGFYAFSLKERFVSLLTKLFLRTKKIFKVFFFFHFPQHWEFFHIVNLISRFILIINLICHRQPPNECKCSRHAFHTIKIDKKKRAWESICKTLSAVLRLQTPPISTACHFKESFTFRIIANFILWRWLSE